MIARPRVPASVLHPVRLLPLIFAGLIAAGTGLLMMPFARAGGGEPSLMDALFTAASAVTVTGLSTVDTATYWSPAGHVIIALLVEVGGIGIVLMATILGLFVGGRLGLRTRLVAQADMHVVGVGEVAPLFRRVTTTTAAFQLVTALVLWWRYATHYFSSPARAAWQAAFDAVMAFNNAGFSLQRDSLTRYVGDYAVILPISLAVFAGGIGFPVLAELWGNWRHPSRWTIHTRLTVWGSLSLLVVAAAVFLVCEWNNPGTIGRLPVADKLVTGIEGGIMPRSGGFNSFDWANARPETTVMAIVMMFIGGGSASTAGGIKVTTFLLLAYVIVAELRGDADVRIGARSIGPRTIRTAMSIALLAVMLVTGGAFALMSLSDAQLSPALFEATSAFGTVGLSDGLTATLGTPAQLVLVALMFIGRVGTITAASFFMIRQRQTRYRYPEEQPIIG